MQSPFLHLVYIMYSLMQCRKHSCLGETVANCFLTKLPWLLILEKTNQVENYKERLNPGVGDFISHRVWQTFNIEGDYIHLLRFGGGKSSFLCETMGERGFLRGLFPFCVTFSCFPFGHRDWVREPLFLCLLGVLMESPSSQLPPTWIFPFPCPHS